MAVETIVKPVSGNATQAVANDDFEAYQREANKADIEARFGASRVEEKTVEPVVEKKEEKPKQEIQKPWEQLTRRELRERVLKLEAENKQLKTPRDTKEAEVVEEPEVKQPETLRARPKSDDQKDGKAKYSTWEQYEDDLLEWNREKIFRDLDERNAKLTQEQQITAVNKTIEQSWRERVAKSRELHADYDAVALDAEKGPGALIMPGSLVDEWLMDSENGAELLYYFGQHPEELKKFEDVDKNFGGTPTTRRAAGRRALVRLEDKITSATTEKEKPKAEETEIRVTKTPKPSSEVGGRGNSLPDPVSAAIAGGTDADTRRYIDEMNRREVRARFGDTRR
jgi:hypothetical protein